MTIVPALCSSIALPSGGVPDWLHLIPAGDITTKDGRGPYRIVDASRVIATSMGLGKLPLDENHATDLAAPKGGSAPARGWIVELQRRSDGIWGRVEWTGPGRRIMEDKEYNGVSPVIAHDKAGNIAAILRASLTNSPNFAGLVSLHSRQSSSDLTAADRHVIAALGVDPQGYTRLKRSTGAQATVVTHHACRAVDQAFSAAERHVIDALGVDPDAYALDRLQSAED